MLKSITIKNFRGIRDLTLNSVGRPFQQFNLIAGKNDSGKTSLLEAIFLLLAPNNPELLLRVNVFRGLEHFKVNPDEMWGWIFHRKNTNQEIEIRAEYSNGSSAYLKVRLVEQSKAKRPLKKGKNWLARMEKQKTSSSTHPKELVLEYSKSGEGTIVSKATVNSEGLKWDRGSMPSSPTGIFITANRSLVQENPERFSKLEEVGRTDSIVEALKIFDSNIKRLALLITGDSPTIHADVGLGRLIPVTYLGEGLKRLLTILLAIADAPGGTVLIDEVENGFHYSVLKDVWKAIANLARQTEINTQVFATTHSYECIQAAHLAFLENEPYDLGLFRLDRSDDTITVASYDQELLEYATEMSHEVR